MLYVPTGWHRYFICLCLLNLKGLNILGLFSAIIVNFCGYLFAFLQTNPLVKRIYSHRGANSFLLERILFRRGYKQFRQSYIPWNICIPIKQLQVDLYFNRHMNGDLFSKKKKKKKKEFSRQIMSSIVLQCIVIAIVYKSIATSLYMYRDF